MNYLYIGPLLKYMEDWLNSYDTDILTTAALALGNFARTDAHCIEMVERGIATKLLGMSNFRWCKICCRLKTSN